MSLCRMFSLFYAVVCRLTNILKADEVCQKFERIGTNFCFKNKIPRHGLADILFDLQTEHYGTLVFVWKSYVKYFLHLILVQTLYLILKLIFGVFV